MTDFLFLALRSLVPNCQYSYTNNQIYWDIEQNNGAECPTQEQIQAKIEELNAAEPLRQLRQQRNQKLAQSDWMAVADRTMTPEQIAYRLSLRDMPANNPNVALNEAGELINVTWPTEPTT